MKSTTQQKKIGWLMSAILACFLGALLLQLVISPPKALASSVPQASSSSASCVVVTYQLTSQWAAGFAAIITITNHCSVSILACWKLDFTFPGNQQVTQMWNGSFSQSGNHVTINSCVVIPPGGSVSIGIIGTWTGSNPPPTVFFLNGEPV